MSAVKGGAWEPFRRVREALAESDLSPTVRHVGLEIGGHLDESGRCFPSLARLARRTGLSLSAVRASVHTLTTGDGRLFDREAGGAREGDRYSSSSYTLRAGEGVASRGAQETRGSSGEREGYTWHAQGVHHVTPKDHRRTSEGGGAPPPSEDRVSWLSEARAIWADSVGAPPPWFDRDLRPLVTPSRTPEAILDALRAYVAEVAPEKAGTGDFGRRIGAWTQRSAKPEAQGEPYRGTQEQLAEKSRRYLEGAA